MHMVMEWKIGVVSNRSVRECIIGVVILRWQRWELEGLERGLVTMDESALGEEIGKRQRFRDVETQRSSCLNTEDLFN